MICLDQSGLETPKRSAILVEEEDTARSNPFLDRNAPAVQGTFPQPPENLPRGLISPPAAVRERIAWERAKHAPAVFAKAEERLLNERTIGHYFDGPCQEVLYRPTPMGPEVLAVGFDEI